MNVLAPTGFHMVIVGAVKHMTKSWILQESLIGCKVRTTLYGTVLLIFGTIFRVV